MDSSDNKDVKLSAEVEPFIPQKKGVDSALLSMNLSGDGAGTMGAEPTPIPSYLITCYPFVQENQPNSRQMPVYNGEVRWQQQCGSAPYVAYSFVSSPPQAAAVCNDYSYCPLLPPPCTPLMGFYQPLTAPYAPPMSSGLGNPVSDTCLRPPQPQGQPISMSAQRGRGGARAPVLPKVRVMSQTGQMNDGSVERVIKKKKKEDDDDEDPLRGLIISSHSVLDEAHHSGRVKCSSCGSSRLLYCYTCCCLVGLNPQTIPTVRLPIKIDIIKHPNETDGKSTAVHAKLLAPDDVSIYTYPCIPELNTHNVALVFPGPDSMTVEELVDYINKNRRKRGAERSPEQRESKKHKPQETSRVSHTPSHTPSHTHTSENTQHTQEHTCPLQRVIFIDSTWNQTTKIITDERLQDFPRVELKSRKTCFWRHQRGSPDTYLSTIEAIYYFLKDFHIHCLLRDYRGEYDNLLFFYTFLHKLIHTAKQARV